MSKHHTGPAVSDEQALTGERYPDVYYEYKPGEIVLSYQEKDGIFAYECASGLCLKVEVISEAIFRFRYAPDGQFERDFSYALLPHTRQSLPRITAGGDEGHYFIQAGKLICRIGKKDMRITLLEAGSQEVLCADAAPYYARRSINHGLEEVKVTKTASEGEHYFGLGDKSGNQNLRGQKLQNWNTDSFAYGKDTDPLYRSIPFYYAVRGGKAYGIFLHNYFRSHFDFDSEHTGQLTFRAEGGEMDYFFIYGPGPMEVAERYHWLTGAPELPPMWALGFHQCRWSYYPEDRVYEIAREFRKRQIPCDAIYLDIDYMDGYRCFTWDKEHFPRPQAMIASLKAQGFQTVVMIDPGIRADDKQYAVYRDGLAKDVFCYRPSGELMRGPVWPPDCVFPDFTRPDVREWWGEWYQELYKADGVSGFWNDMNEPAVFKVNSATVPDEVLHGFDGKMSNHRRAHNIYGQQMSRATYEGLRKLNPGKRPFVLTRATFSGGQRYASVWTGDNVASWEHLRLANLQCQRLSASGFSFAGSDIGGFKGQPDGELFVRWLQLAVFHPLFRVHSMGNNIDGAAEAEAEAVHEAERTNRADQEPWSFGEPYTSLAREAIEFRYRLLPYLYTAFYFHTKKGQPILRSLFLYSPSDIENLGRENEFLFGDGLLVIPVLEPGVTLQKGYLPEGRWYDYWQGTLYEGHQEVSLPVSPSHIPVMARAGAVIPNYPVRQYTGEKPLNVVSLRAYYGNGEGHLYEDAGDGYAYQSGEYRLRTFRTLTGHHHFSLSQEQEGLFAVAYKTFRAELFGLPYKAAHCLADGRELPFQQQEQVLVVDIPEGFRELIIR
ncbi:MAG: glycoside hydrolase family 31 protein [Phaeodactylibacter sp.]|nr:glycoside hydrolase family 31 protein [Phaeodactylibacter sp.]MCB9274345.1 glycoside hydrolase family 31 protein [Lewinellaceae bacterium]